jgi:predicted DNA-binding transcriptional regulator AlpA
MKGTALKRPIERLAYRRTEAAAALGVSANTFDTWVQNGLMPRPIHVGGCVLWDAAQLQVCWQMLAEGSAVDSANPWDA